MSGLLNRRATAADLPAIVALLDDDVQSRGREDPSLPLDPRYLTAFAEIDGNPDQLLVVAEQDGAVVGSMQLTFIPGIAFRGAWRMQIEAVRIAGAVRGQGLGAEMIAWAVDQARARGCEMVQLTSMATRTDAHRFYERLGFVKSHVGMKLKLTDTVP
jgi:GNAT superfamily N-acetyltransferase